MNEPTLLLAAKLLAPAPGRLHLVRERLHRKLAEGLRSRATVVLGGPGYGKTSLMARFLEEPERESVWYRLDGSDRDPWMFFRYLIEAIRQHAPDFGERSAGLWEGFRSQPGDVERLADVFIRDAEESLGGRLVVVLDGAEALEESPACSRAVRRLLSYLPGTLHLVLVGRTIPDLGVKALVAQGEAAVLPAEELLLTLEETHKLLVETFGLRVGPEFLRRIHERTRGWVTALQLLWQTARLHPDAELPADVFDRTEAEIFDYFSEEVLAAEPPEVRGFLLATSLLPVIDPDLVGIEGGDARAVLSRLVQRNLFVSSLQSHKDLYSYDPLFRDFLAKKFHTERGAGEARRLHRTYGLAFAGKGDFVQALFHLLAAEDVPATSDVLASRGRTLLLAGNIDKVREAALFSLHHGVRAAFVHDLLGEASRLAGDHAAAVRHFEKALSQPDPGTDPLRGRSRANALQGLAYSLLKVGEVTRAASAAEEGFKEAGDEDPILIARILNTLSIIRYHENRHDEAIAGWRDALALARQGADEHLTLMIAHNLGLPYAATGDFHRAAECFRLLTRDENLRLGPEEGAAYLNLARIATLRGEYAQAARLLDDAQEIAQKWKLQGLVGDVLEAQGTLLRESGHLEAAGEKYALARALFTSLGLVDVLDSLAEEEAILAALRGDVGQADRVASGVVDRARASAEPQRIAAALLAQGEIQARCGDPRAAERPLEEAARLFEKAGHSYEQCMSHLWLSLARQRRGDGPGATRAASVALRLASRFDYDGAVTRVVNLDAALRKTIAAIPSAPAFLIETEAAAGVGSIIEPDRPDLIVRLLGPTEVFRDPDRKIPPSAWKLRKALKIFCYLSASRNHRATKDRLIDVMWGDARPSVVEKNFHPTISFLRRALNHGHHVPKNFILCEAGAYRLNPTYTYDIDGEAFEMKIHAARRKAAQGDALGALAEYDDALRLYRGAFLEEDDEAWVEAPRSHYESLYLASLAEAGGLQLQKGDPEAGLSLLRKLVEHDPLDEQASVRLMKALGSRGQRGAIEKEYRRLERALEEAYSHPPSPKARREYRMALDEAPEKR